MSESISLQRDCDAIQIPYGNTITARAGTLLSIVHQLGDSYTLRTEHGYLLRIAAKDADALGREPPAPTAESTNDLSAEVRAEDLWEVLKTCFDPEIPANIVDLGLIYEVNPSRLPAGGYRVDVKMTLTAPGCGMGQVLKDDVEGKMLGVQGVAEVDVELVFQPPWDPTMMSEAARLQLGMM